MRDMWRRRLSAKFLSVLLALSLSAPFALAITAPRVAGQARSVEQRGVPPSRYIPSHDFGTRNITLNLHFDWEKEQAIGTATITFSPLVPNLQNVQLDAANMTFNSIKLASGTPLRFVTDTQNEQLRVALDHAYQPSDTVTIVVDYHTNGVVRGRSVNGGSGLTFIKPTTDDPKRPRQIWSQGESEYNHYWFPCYDHPNDFFTSEIIATVEKPLSVISNGKLVSTRSNSDGTRTFDWKIDQPHASYLTSIVVGEYAPVESTYAGIPVITNVYPSEVEEGRISAARIADMVRFFSEKTGVKYPYAKYAQTMARDFGGGMENISATTLTDTTVHDARAELDQTSDSLMSHELAHQWFGDYVTCRSWADIWLNESFATYFQALWDEHNLGRDDFLYSDVKNNQDQYYAAWARGDRRPIVTENYQNPDAVFDTYAYPRGGAVLHMLRMQLGDDNWWRAINHYLTKYAHQPVETEQFRIAIEEATGQSMDRFFDQWVYRMGHPIFHVTQTYDAPAASLTLTVRQEQKPDANAGYPQAGLFQAPVDIEIGTAAGTRVERAMIQPQEEQTLVFKVDGPPKLVNFDYGDTLIKEVRFDKSTDDLVYQLSKDPDVTGRVWALGQLTGRMNNSATAATDKDRITGALSSALTQDSFWGVRLDAADALKGAPSPKAREALLAAIKDPKARVRARAIVSLTSTRDPALAPVFRASLNDPSYAVIRAAALALGQTKSPEAYDALMALINTPSWRDTIRASGLSGLAALGDKRAADLGFRYAVAGNPTGVRGAALTLIANTGKDDPRAFQTISDAFTRAVSNGEIQLGFISASALLELGDPRSVGIFEQAAGKVDSPQIKGFLLQFAQRARSQGSANGNRPPNP